MSYTPHVTPADLIQVLALGDAVLLVEVTPPGVKGLRFEVPLADYHDGMADNFRGWVAYLRQSQATEPAVFVIHRA